MGGKSRKSGGVSKKLIDRLKAGNYSSSNKKGIKSTKDENKTRDKSIFDAGKDE
jgi:hypothetical protein